MFWADQFDDDIRLLALEGRLSRTDLVDLAQRLRGLAAQGMFLVVVDLRAVAHWDYRGLGALAEAVAYRRRWGGHTAFVTPDPYLRNVARAAGFGGDLEFYDGLRLAGPRESAPGGTAFPLGEPVRRAASQ